MVRSISKYGNSNYHRVLAASTNRSSASVHADVDKIHRKAFQALFSQADHENNLKRSASRSPFICGSGSASRRLILENAGFSFDVVKADIDERAIGDRSDGSLERAQALVMLLGHRKADAIMKRLQSDPVWQKCLQSPVSNNDASAGFCIESRLGSAVADVKPLPRPPHRVLLTADQVVICNGVVLEKPMDEAEARGMLALYAQHPCSTVGSLVLTDLQSGKRYERQDTTTVFFEPRSSPEAALLWDAAIDGMLADGMCIHCAGALMIESPLLLPVLERVEGSEESVLGMSTMLLEQVFADFESDVERREAGGG